MDINRGRYHKLYVLSPQYYNEIVKKYSKPIQHSSNLDTALSTILNNSKLEPYTKWLQYKYLLMKYANEHKKMNEIQQTTKDDDELQTIKKEMKDSDMQTDAVQKEMKDFIVQTDVKKNERF